MPNTTELEKNFAQIVIGAKTCLNLDLPMPALILIYTLADAFAWAVSPDESNTRTRFENWVDKYVNTAGALPCTSTELYAARCAVVHTLTSKSDLHKRGSVRQVAYAWGNTNLGTISHIAALGSLDTEVVGLHINELLEAVTAGIRRTFEDSNTQPDLARRLEQSASRHYIQPPRHILEEAAKRETN